MKKKKENDDLLQKKNDCKCERCNNRPSYFEREIYFETGYCGQEKSLFLQLPLCLMKLFKEKLNFGLIRRNAK